MEEVFDNLPDSTVAVPHPAGNRDKGMAILGLYCCPISSIILGFLLATDSIQNLFLKT